MKPKLFAYAVAASFVLASCQNQSHVSIVENHESGYFASEEYAHDATRGEMTVVVRGSAFGLDQISLEQLILKNMQDAEWGRHAHFTTKSGPEMAQVYSYVVMVNGPHSVNAASLCNKPLQAITSEPMPVAGELSIVADLCRFDKVANSVSAKVTGVMGPDDSKTGAIIALSVLELTRPDQQGVFEREHGDGSQIHP